MYTIFKSDSVSGEYRKNTLFDNAMQKLCLQKYA
jgi:hypothetical protein